VKVRHQSFEILARVDVIEFAGLNERKKNRRSQRTSLGVSSVPGLSPDDMVSE
jgi:hypothetical protein